MSRVARRARSGNGTRLCSALHCPVVFCFRSRAPDGGGGLDSGVDADGYVQMGLVRSMVKSAAKAKSSPGCPCPAPSPIEFLRATKRAAASGGALASDPEPTYLPMSPIRPPGFEKNRSD